MDQGAALIEARSPKPATLCYVLIGYGAYTTLLAKLRTSGR